MRLISYDREHDISYESCSLHVVLDTRMGPDNPKKFFINALIQDGKEFTDHYKMSTYLNYEEAKDKLFEVRKALQFGQKYFEF